MWGGGVAGRVDRQESCIATKGRGHAERVNEYIVTCLSAVPNRDKSIKREREGGRGRERERERSRASERPRERGRKARRKLSSSS